MEFVGVCLFEFHIKSRRNEGMASEKGKENSIRCEDFQ